MLSDIFEWECGEASGFVLPCVNVGWHPIQCRCEGKDENEFEKDGLSYLAYCYEAYEEGYGDESVHVGLGLGFEAWLGFNCVEGPITLSVEEAKIID